MNRSVLVARLLWIFPVILAFLAVNQGLVALDLRQTLAEGAPAEAEVLAIEKTDRADITMASARLRVPLESGEVIERDLPMPITFAKNLEGSETLDVRVNLGADQEIVLAELGQAQWRLAAINSAMSLMAFVLLTVGVFAWNRYLKRKGDPSTHQPEAAREQPAV